MKAKDFFLSFLVAFALAFFSCLLATLAWNYFNYHVILADWNVCFTLAVIIGLVVPLSEIRPKRKTA